MKYKFCCDCFFILVLDVLGDRWMLVIVKLMLLDFKEIFKDFMESDEVIVFNIFLVKFKLFEEFKIIIKFKCLDNKKINYYYLMEKGLVLILLLMELVVWSDGYLRDFYLIIEDGENMKCLWKDKVVLVEFLEKRYRDKLVIVMYLW